MGGRRTSKEVEELLLSTWDWFKQQWNQEPSAQQVLKKARVQLQQQGRDASLLPKLRKVQLLLAGIRQKEAALPGHVKKIDKLWTLASLEDYPISPEALPAVLRVWKLHLARGIRFSIRQAQWVARLHTVIEDIVNLSDWAYVYASRERASEGLGQTPESSDLDTALVMGFWELATACWVGKARSIRSGALISLVNPSPQKFGDRSSWRSSEEIEGSLYTELQLEIFEAAKLEKEDIREESVDKTKWIAEEEARLERLKTQLGKMDIHQKGLAELRNLNDSEEAEWVYAHWLMYLHKGPNWQSLSMEERLGIISRLRDWIQNHPWTGGTEELPAHSLDDVERLAAEPLFKPTELLKEVGYEVTEDKDQEGQAEEKKKGGTP